MEKSHINKAIEQVKLEAKERKFSQSYDFIINVKEIDLKKIENQKEFFVTLPHQSKKRKICALVGPELKDEAKKVCDKTILVDDFDNFAKDKKATKKLADEFDYFIAQSTVMPKVAGAFGKVFGPRGKMPNPKAGCVVPPKVQLAPLLKKLQTLVKVSLKKSPVIHAMVGIDSQPMEEISNNVKTLYDAVIHQLPYEEKNIKSAILKLTMGKPVKIQ